MRNQCALGIVLLGGGLGVLTTPNHPGDEPDLEVTPADITCTPNPAPLNSPVTVSADIRNVGNCYIVLGDNSDEVSYNNSFTTNDVIRIRARMRSSNGDPLTGRASIGANVAAFTTSITGSGWQIVETSNITVPATGNNAVDIRVLTGADVDTQLEIDYFDAERMTGPTTYELLFTREAEDYDAGGSTVDTIYPQGVQVELYDGDPNAGGTQIGSTQTVGDVTKATESGNVQIVTESGVPNAAVTWTATPSGSHNIYAVILNSPRESSTANNQAFGPCQAMAAGPALPLWGMIAMILVMAGTAVVILRGRMRALRTG